MRFGEAGGGEDADVGVDVAGVVDVGCGGDGLEGDVRAVAAGLVEGVLLGLMGEMVGLVWEGEGAYDFGGFHHWELPEVAGEEADPEEGCFLCQLGELGLDVVGGLVFALSSSDCQRSDHPNSVPTRRTSM